MIVFTNTKSVRAEADAPSACVEKRERVFLDGGISLLFPSFQRFADVPGTHAQSISAPIR